MNLKHLATIFALFASLFSFSQINRESLFTPVTPPNPFDKSRISQYINATEINPDDYEGFYQRGLLNIKSGLFQEAIDNFRHLIFPLPERVGAEPEFAEPYFYIGVCKSELQEYDSAISYFTQAVEINPVHSEAYNERGILYLDKGFYKEALADFENAFKFDQQSVHALYNVGYCYFLMGDYKLAKKKVKSLIKMSPEYEWSYILLGYMDYSAGKYNKAKKSFTKAIQFNANEAAAYYYRGLSEIRMNRPIYDEAYISRIYNDMKKVIELNPEEYNAFFFCGMIELFRYNTASALEYFYLSEKQKYSVPGNLEEITPFESENFYLLKVLHDDQILRAERKLAQAFFYDYYNFSSNISMADINSYLTDHPESMFINRLLFFHLLSLQHLEKIGEVADRILSLDSGIVSVKTVKAELMILDGKKDEGIALLKNLDNESENSAYLPYKLGMELGNVGEYDKSIASLDKALTIAPDYDLAYVERAKSKMKTKQYNDGLKDVKTALGYDLENAMAWHLGGYAYNRLDYPDSAIMMLQMAKYYNPYYAPSYAELAYSYTLKDDPNAVMKELNTMIRVFPKSSLAYYSRGKFYLSGLSNPKEALADYSKALELNPESSFLKNEIGDVYFYYLRDFQAAIDAYLSNDGSDSEKFYATLMTARSYSNLEQNENAINYFEKAISLDTTNAEVWYYLGYVYRKTDNNPEAIRSFLEAAAIDTSYATAYGAAGWTCYLNAEFEKCIEYSEIAVRLDDEAYYAMFNIALATLRLGEMEEAERLYQKYTEEVSNVEDYDNNGAITDLKNLIDENILVEEARKILKEYFGVEE